jgi:FkbM family methyltransferase
LGVLAVDIGIVAAPGALGITSLSLNPRHSDSNRGLQMSFRRSLSNVFQRLQATAIYRLLRSTWWFESLVIIPIERLGILEREIDDEYLRKIVGSDHPTIIEIGADSGTDTLRLSKLFPGGRVLSFEPDPRNVPRVSSRISGLENVELTVKAVSNFNGKAVFHLSAGKSGGGQGSSSLREPNLTTTIFPEIEFRESVEVDCIRLDDFCVERGISRIDFLWMDVQGAEDMVIDGGVETFRDRVRFLYTEYSNLEMYKGQIDLDGLMARLPGYRIERIYTSNVLLKNTRPHASG